MKTNVTLDIETIPTQNEEVKKRIATTIKPPGNLKKPESIAEWKASKMQAAIDEKVNKTSLDGAFGQIYCIGLAYEDHEPISFRVHNYKNPEEEKQMLIQFNDAMAELNPYFIGHNLIGFDMRFLYQRMIVHRIKPKFKNPCFSKPWDDDHFDTMVAWSGVKDRIKLDSLCHALGVPTPKNGIDGSKVWQYVKAGKGDEVVEYCLRDIVATRECANILREYM